ncbi:MAG: hypothetical protein U9R19_03460 [Bacteroidota bacterium]|nr:hypothetical protein [Bacteroidota bacterium]
MKKVVSVFLLFVFVLQVFAQSQSVSFTLEDRDRIMRTEEKLESLRKEMNIRFEALDSKFEAIDSRFEAIDLRFEALDSKFEAIDSKFEAIDSKFEAMETKIDAIKSKVETLYWGFGIMITLMLFLFGYIVWDRKTALNPVQNKTISLEEKVNKIEIVYREQAQNDPVFAKLLRHAGLL